MDLDALLKTLLDAVGDNPTMVLLLTVGFFLLKMLFPKPAPASTQVLNGYAERIRLALLAGNTDGAKALADAGIAKTAELLQVETEPKPKGILDIFTGLFTGGNMMPLLMIGGVFLLLMLTQGGGCKKASAGPSPIPATSAADIPAFNLWKGESAHVRPAVWRPDSVAAGRLVCSPVGFEWAEPAAGTVAEYGQGADGSDCRGNCSAQFSPGGPPVIRPATLGTCCHGPQAASSGPTRYRVGWQPGPRTGPVASTARFVLRPAARAAVGIARIFRWARPFRRAATLFRCGRG